MSASWLRVLGLIIVSAWLAAGCSNGTGGGGGTGGTTGGGDALGTGGSSGPDAATPDEPVPVPVTVSSPTLDLGSVEVGQTSAPYSVMVTNLGPATWLIPQIIGSPFSLAVNTCTPLPANGTCIISVVFTPTNAGPATGTMVVAGTVMVSLTGIGIPLPDFTQTDHIDLGTVMVGASVSGKVTVTATTPLTDLLCSVSSAGNIKPDPITTNCPTAVPGALAAGASCFLGFTFSSSTRGEKSGDEIICGAGSVTKITSVTALVVTAAKLIIAPPLGSTYASVGMSRPITFTVANGGGSPTGTITAAITPPDPEFVVSGTTCAVGLLPLGTCTVTVTFTRTSYGMKTATLVVTDSDAPAFPATATVTGPDEGPSGDLYITGGPDLGTVALGETGNPVAFTIKNISGTDAAGVVVMTNNPAFVIGNDGCTGMTLPRITGTCTFTVTFAPPKDGLPGGYNGMLTVSSGPGYPFNLPITATAIKPATDGGVNDSADASDGGTGDGPKPDAATPDGP